MPRGIPGSGPSDAKNNPVAPSKGFEPLEQQIGQDHDRVMKSTGPAREALQPQYVQIVDRPLKELDQEKLAMLQFFEEPVTIMVHTTSDQNAEQVFELFNNGRREVFTRGETKTVARKFVEILATRKPTTYTQKKKRDEDGIMHEVQVPTTALRYPFSVLHDPNPKGADWLRYTLATAG